MDQRKRLLHDINTLAHWVNIPFEIQQQRYSRDPDDDKFIHTTLTANSPWLISGDQDLLILTDDLKIQGINILSPADAMNNPAFLSQ